MDIDNIRRAEQHVAERAANPNYDHDYRQTRPEQVDMQVAERAANPNYDRDYRQAHPDQVQGNNDRRASAHALRREQRRADARIALVNIDDRPDENPAIDPSFLCGSMDQRCGECDAWFCAWKGVSKEGTAYQQLFVFYVNDVEDT